MKTSSQSNPILAYATREAVSLSLSKASPKMIWNALQKVTQRPSADVKSS